VHDWNLERLERSDIWQQTIPTVHYWVDFHALYRSISYAGYHAERHYARFSRYFSTRQLLQYDVKLHMISLSGLHTPAYSRF